MVDILDRRLRPTGVPDHVNYINAAVPAAALAHPLARLRIVPR